MNRLHISWYLYSSSSHNVTTHSSSLLTSVIARFCRFLDGMLYDALSLILTCSPIKYPRTALTNCREAGPVVVIASLYNTALSLQQGTCHPRRGNGTSESPPRNGRSVKIVLKMLLFLIGNALKQLNLVPLRQSCLFFLQPNNYYLRNCKRKSIKSNI